MVQYQLTESFGGNNIFEQLNISVCNFCFPDQSFRQPGSSTFNMIRNLNIVTKFLQQLDCSFTDMRIVVIGKLIAKKKYSWPLVVGRWTAIERFLTFEFWLLTFSMEPLIKRRHIRQFRHGTFYRKPNRSFDDSTGEYSS